MSIARTSLLAAATLLPLPAFAGGIGIVSTAGGHGDRVWGYYDDEQLLVDNQLNANFGGGIEIVLGDRDNKVLGIFRGYYMQDSPEKSYTFRGSRDIERKDIVSVHRETPREIGVINAGIQWGLLGDPGGLQLTLVSTLGAGVFTNDLTEFLQAELGPGATWMATRQLQVALSVTGGVRYRKHFYPTGNAYLGVRYLFD